MFRLGSLGGRLALSYELLFWHVLWSKHAQFATSDLNEFLVDFFETSLNQRVPLHHSSGLRHDVPVIRIWRKHFHIIIAIHWEFQLMLFCKGTVTLSSFTICANLRCCFLPSREPPSSTNSLNRANPRARQQVLKNALLN